MKIIKDYLLWVVTLLMFISIGIPSMVFHFNRVSSVAESQSRFVEPVYGEERPESLAYIEGASVLGMVSFALDGEYTLILDGILINKDTDAELVNFSGVAGNMYKIAVDKDSTGETVIVADVQ